MFILILIIILGSRGAQEDTDTSTAVGDDSQITSEAVSSSQRASNQNPEIIISVDELIDAYQANELAADQQYKNKVVQVSGSVDQITEILGSKRILISGANNFGFNTVSCPIENDQLDKAVALSKGSGITVQGTVRGYNQISVELRKCTIQ